MAKRYRLAWSAGLAIVALGGLVFLLRPDAEQEAAMRRSSDAKTESPRHQTGNDGNFSFENAGANAQSPPQPAKNQISASEEENELAALRGNVVVSFGKVEDIGLQAGYIIPSLSEMRALAATDPSKLSPEQRVRLLDLQRRYADLLGVLPEITGFQNNPAEYGKFFANLAKQSAGLTGPQVTQVDGYMRARANEMIQAGLNEANKPPDPSQMDAWEARRDQFNEQTVAGLRQVLSPQIADRAGINEKLLEFLERDFDKSGTQPGLN